MPRCFTDDWVTVAAEESMHLALLDRRLRALASHYGALPAHDGLWEAADATRHDVIVRLAVVPQVQEERGLDVTPEQARRRDSDGERKKVGEGKRVVHRVDVGGGR